VLCRNSFDNYGEEYDRAADKYFKNAKRPTMQETIDYYRERKIGFVSFTVDAESNLGRMRISNEEIADTAAANSDIMIAFGSIDPHKGKMGAREARRLVESCGVRGFKFHPTVQGFEPADKMAWPIYEVIAEHKLPAIFHSRHSGIGSVMRCGSGLRLQNSNPMFFEDVAIAYPDIQIVIAHPSWPWQDGALSLAMHKPNIWIDLAGWSPKYFLPQLVQYANTEIVKFQEGVGLKSITDGEFRRTYFHLDFSEQFGGVKVGEVTMSIHAQGKEHLIPPAIHVVDKVTHAKQIQLADFQYLKSQIAVGSILKVTIPSPTMLHFRGGRAGIDRKAYPELDPEFYDDVAMAYGDELKSLSASGCNYVQMDDTNLAYLCDPKMREAAQALGDDPNELPRRYASFINKVVAHKPAGMTLAMHLCRGNFKSTFAARGDYEPVAEALHSEMDIDAYFLEYDHDRSGDFRPLRFLKKGKTVVLGLVTTKVGQNESKDDLKRRIEQAAQYASLDQLALSPQCGFLSTVHGNNIAVEDQRGKLRLVVETVQEVWG
jgi:5-methyltetrahydropteroyltriglutamate--homocysteine methyltransferase